MLTVSLNKTQTISEDLGWERVNEIILCVLCLKVWSLTILISACLTGSKEKGKVVPVLN
jgi:hypothetical protein